MVVPVPANRQRIPRAEREAEIVAAARDEFAAQGFEAATVGSIARRAGMTSANVHYYFATKEALFAAVARGAYDQLLADLDGRDDPVERLRRYVRFHLAQHAIRPQFQAIAARAPEVAELLVRREAWLAKTATEITSDELDAAALAAVVTGLIEVAEPHPDPDLVIDHAVARLRSTP